jgi:hypothetical protein
MSPNPNTRHGPLRLEPGSIHAFAVSWEVDIASAFTKRASQAGIEIRNRFAARQECPVDAAGRHAGQTLTTCLLHGNFG